ncbi:uncharacterized protein LOC129774986 [Toxorhynchites rutilus septentrionalis]|uniref:uncharacterized protein LOC129774986 n=1 Tax=Toxorhynchites rutilus septentrionalis TaxID=329112 RepID=UPI002479A060|nr:uncharacterized protein LOC129774986 [Toxorhynchites rutilus septentrionalis]
MASTRAFNILEQRNSNENQRVGKSQLTGKNEARAPFKLALKDLTNSTTSRSNFAGKQLQDTIIKKPLQQKSAASSFLQKKSTESITQGGTKRQNPFTIFTPQEAEYSWGKETCLREDLLEQLIEFNGVVYKRDRKPMKPLKMDPPELPEITLPKASPKATPTVPKDLPNSFLFNLTEVEIPDLDFMF